jgi:UDPglucose 6-dehydrogenase
MGADERIGHGFLYAGCGYGGSCFPKDTQALVSTAKLHGHDMAVVSATEHVNERQKRILVDRVVQHAGEDLTGLKIALWGLAFKPNTDDMREAPSRVVIRELLMRGAQVSAYDPVASVEAMKALREDFSQDPELLTRFEIVPGDMQALQDADALLVLTEWKNFHNPDFEAMKAIMRTPFIVDGRNLYNPMALLALGMAYQGVGRRNALVQGLTFERRILETPNNLKSQPSVPSMSVNA